MNRLVGLSKVLTLSQSLKLVEVSRLYVGDRQIGARRPGDGPTVDQATAVSAPLLSSGSRSNGRHAEVRGYTGGTDPIQRLDRDPGPQIKN
jgi:hypothetical protein